MKSIILASALLAATFVTNADMFKLSSPTIAPDATLNTLHLFNGFGCQGKNISPELSWFHAPKETQSFAVTIYDPDAPTGSGWWHWIVYDIPAAVNRLTAGAGVLNSRLLPESAKQGRNDFGSYDFGGACPPIGDVPHRYIITVYALKIAHLPLPTQASAAMIGFMIQANQLAKAELHAKYGR